jgi:uncharacterized membrane protein YhaH (DUF805 family)
MSFGIAQFIPLLILSGGFPIPLIVALVIFFKKRKREKMILKREIKKFLWVNFSLEGRIHREDYWYYGYGLYWITNIAILLIFLLIFFIVYKLLIAFTPLTGGTIGAPHVIIFLFYLSYGMKFFANKIKRLHDNNKSGSFLLWTLIPILGQLFGLYIFITNWFMRGTIGSNDFGDDPVKKDITPVITIKDAANTLGLLLIVSALIAGYVFLVTLITS